MVAMLDETWNELTDPVLLIVHSDAGRAGGNSSHRRSNPWKYRPDRWGPPSCPQPDAAHAELRTDDAVSIQLSILL